MANMCYFEMEARGTEENIKSFVACMKNEGDFYMGRGASVELMELDATPDENGKKLYLITGECKWSVASAMTKEKSSPQCLTLWEACEKWEIEMELYSEESGMGFQEHFAFVKGNKYEECVDYDEYCFDEYETKEEAEEKFGISFSKDEWEEGNCYRGGYEWSYDLLSA